MKKVKKNETKKRFEKTVKQQQTETRKVKKAFDALVESGERGSAALSVLAQDWNPRVYHRKGIVKDLLSSIGEDIGREGLLETPLRVAKFYETFFTKGNKPNFKLTTFEGEGSDQMVCQINIPFYSLCEHHMLPFFGEAAVAYIPSKRIIGLSKLARVVQFFAQRLQNQERLSKQIGECLQRELNPLGVGVVLRARHLCMEMRGVKCAGTSTTTSYLSGVFKKEGPARAEFLELVRVKL